MDIKHEVMILVAIAKVDAELNARRQELEGIPEKQRRLEREIAKIDKSKREAQEHWEAMRKERRRLEAALEDNSELIKKYKTQLLTVKTNKEYAAILKEIETVEKDTDQKEERLLILMDEMDGQAQQNEEFLARLEQQRKERVREQEELARRKKQLEEEMGEWEGKKPALLAELSPSLRKRYERILAKLGDVAVTNVRDQICQGCFSKIPPQTANEVKLNDRIITCQTCGRILVHF